VSTVLLLHRISEKFVWVGSVRVTFRHIYTLYARNDDTRSKKIVIVPLNSGDVLKHTRDAAPMETVHTWNKTKRYQRISKKNCENQQCIFKIEIQPKLFTLSEELCKSAAKLGVNVFCSLKNGTFLKRMHWEDKFLVFCELMTFLLKFPPLIRSEAERHRSIQEIVFRQYTVRDGYWFHSDPSQNSSLSSLWLIEELRDRREGKGRLWFFGYLMQLEGDEGAIVRQSFKMGFEPGTFK